MVRRVAVVFCQQVYTPVSREVPPYAVDVISIVLCVVILNQKCAALHAVVMTYAFFETAHPGKFDLVETSLTDLAQSLTCFLERLRAQVFFD